MVTSSRWAHRASSPNRSISPTCRRPSRARRRQRSRTYSSRSQGELCAMSDPRPLEKAPATTGGKRVPFPLTDEHRAREMKPLQQRGFRNSSMVQLTLVRFREFIREPEAVFWTFVFPILLSAGLGIALMQRGPDKLPIGVITSATGNVEIVDALKKDSTLIVQTFDDSSAPRALRTGKLSLRLV